jgi:hypothetical protein
MQMLRQIRDAMTPMQRVLLNSLITARQRVQQVLDSPASHDPTGLAVPMAAEGQRARRVVSAANAGCACDAQDADRGSGILYYSPLITSL